MSAHPASLMASSRAEKSAAPIVFNLGKTSGYDLSTAAWEMFLFDLKSWNTKKKKLRISFFFVVFLFICGRDFFFFSAKQRQKCLVAVLEILLEWQPTQHPDKVLFCWRGCYSGVVPSLLWLPNIRAESWIISARSSTYRLSRSSECSGSETYFFRDY